jgi:hypothetical protein
VNPSPSALATTAGTRHLLPATRVLLGAFAVLTALAFGSLFVLAPSTERSFAWTIQPPLTAAFIGAGYGAGFLLVVLSQRAGTWACVRVPVLTIFVFVVLTLAATVIHLDRLHFAAEFLGLGALAKGAAWFWFVVYLLVPVATLVLLVAQERASGIDPPARHPVPPALRVALGLESAVLFVVGVLLYAVPSSAATVWPWVLTPFTGRIIAAWLLAFAAATALASVAGDLERLRTAAIAYTAFGALVLVAVLRFPSTLDWSDPTTWLFVAVAVAVTATGGIGWRLSPAPVGPSRG